MLAALDRLGGPPVFLEVHRLAPFGFRSADVGVVMDLMIHDLDILNHLVGEEPVRVDAVGVPVIGPNEDIANARLTFPSGCVANVTASRVSLQRMRRIRIFSREAYLSLDYGRREAMLVRRSSRMQEWMARCVDVMGCGAPNGGPCPDFGDLLDVEKLPIHEAEPLKEEITALVDAIRGARPPQPGGDEGLRAVRLAERILETFARTRCPAARPAPSPETLVSRAAAGRCEPCAALTAPATPIDSLPLRFRSRVHCREVPPWPASPSKSWSRTASTSVTASAGGTRR